MLVKSNHIKPYMLEKCVNNPERGVGLRRKVIAKENNLTKALTELPYIGYDYSKVGAFCFRTNYCSSNFIVIYCLLIK
jgi:hydroxymethylglutaryl-CoA reductase (NADPH)